MIKKEYYFHINNSLKIFGAIHSMTRNTFREGCVDGSFDGDDDG